MIKLKYSINGRVHDEELKDHKEFYEFIKSKYCYIRIIKISEE